MTSKFLHDPNFSNLTRGRCSIKSASTPSRFRNSILSKSSQSIKPHSNPLPDHLPPPSSNAPHALFLRRQIVPRLQLSQPILLKTDSIDVNKARRIDGVKVQELVHRGLVFVVELLGFGAAAQDVAVALVEADFDLAVLCMLGKI